MRDSPALTVRPRQADNPAAAAASGRRKRIVAIIMATAPISSPIQSHGFHQEEARVLRIQRTHPQNARTSQVVGIRIDENAWAGWKKIQPSAASQPMIFPGDSFPGSSKTWMAIW